MLAAGGLAAAAAIAFLLFSRSRLRPVRHRPARPATVVAATPTSAIALAVLPFANLSSDPEQEFFSDGLTEEITSALAKIPDLSVVARTSAFEFKGQNRNIRTIGEQLGATHLIEGSVRKAGDRVRITVQLIKADDGTASGPTITTASSPTSSPSRRTSRQPLRAPYGSRSVWQRGRASGLQSQYRSASIIQQYLRAKALVDARSYTEAINLLEPVTTRDPNYAPAWALFGGLPRCGAPNLHPAFWNGEVEELGPRRRYFSTEGRRGGPARNRVGSRTPEWICGAWQYSSPARKISSGARVLCQGAGFGPQQSGSFELKIRSACRHGICKGSPPDETTIARAGTLRSHIYGDHRYQPVAERRDGRCDQDIQGLARRPNSFGFDRPRQDFGSSRTIWRSRRCCIGNVRAFY